MVRQTAQQRAELVQLHLQGESIDAIVQQTEHARTTVLRWVRRFVVDGLLLDRPRSGRPLSVMTPTVVGRISDNWRRPNEVVGVDQRVRLLLC